MATSKTITVTQQYSNNATSPSAVSFSTEPIVADGVLVPDYRVTNPGVFVFNTPKEGVSSNPTNDSTP